MTKQYWRYPLIRNVTEAEKSSSMRLPFDHHAAVSPCHDHKFRIGIQELQATFYLDKSYRSLRNFRYGRLRQCLFQCECLHWRPISPRIWCRPVYRSYSCHSSSMEGVADAHCFTDCRGGMGGGKHRCRPLQSTVRADANSSLP